MVNPTEPLPLPGVPEVIVSHDASDDAVQPQPLNATTAAVPLPPAADTLLTGKETV